MQEKQKKEGEKRKIINKLNFFEFFCLKCVLFEKSRYLYIERHKIYVKILAYIKYFLYLCIVIKIHRVMWTEPLFTHKFTDRQYLGIFYKPKIATLF